MGRTSNAKEKLLDVAFRLIWNSSYGTVSVDDICAQAGVKKGSFYHFFESKAALLVAAYDEHWRLKQPEMDRMFSPQVPGLERIANWCQFMLDVQKQKAADFGHVCGCPYASVGAEMATQDDLIRAKCEQMMTRTKKYLESAIADANREGTADCPHPQCTANLIYSFVLGSLLQAKVQNNLELLQNLEPTVMCIVRPKATAGESRELVAA